MSTVTLKLFKKEWFEYTFDLFEWPKMRYNKETKEFIINVPRSYENKVQYVPFIYKNYRTEINS